MLDRMPRYTRRQILAGAALAATRLRAADPPVSEAMAKLSTFMADAANRALPETVVEKGKQMILDTLAAMISGSELPPGKFAVQFARAYGGPRVSTVVGSNVVCGPIEAALANGILAHSDETDDSHSPSQSHPAASVVPSALAVGEKFGIDGTRFLRSVVLGYDVGPRFTMTLGKVEYMAASHRSTHALSGTFGSAAASGCAAGLSARQMRWLLSYTAQQASGIATWQRDTDHIEKAFDFAGMSARDGVTAALLVQAGATGVDDVLSGADNLFLAFQPMNDPAMFTSGLGERYEITRTNVKKWTVGSPIQAPLDALEALMKANGFTAAQVAEVEVRVASNEARIVDNRDIPDICLQHMLAVMLLDKTVTFRSAHDEARMQDRATLAERAKVKLIQDTELDPLLPKRAAIVTVKLADGRTLRERVETVRGTAENPMTRDEVLAKARDLIVPVLGRATCEKLIETVFAIERVKNITALRPLIARG